MSEQPTNEPCSSEIQFGDSAKWHIKALRNGEINSNDAAEKLLMQDKNLLLI